MEVEEENTEEELLELEENNDSYDIGSESEKEESSSLVSDKRESKKTSKAVPIAVASGIAVVLLAAVVVKSVFEVKLLAVLTKLFKFK